MLRFGHAFALLMLLALGLSLFLPASASERVAGSVQSVFAIVSAPLHWLSGLATSRPVEPAIAQIEDERERLRVENAELRRSVESLTMRLEAFVREEAERARLGADLGRLARPIRVVGVEGDARQRLRLLASDTPLATGDIVLHSTGSGGVAGQILTVGAGNQAIVRLITDPGAKLLANAGRFRREDGQIVFQTLFSTPFVVEGIGGGELKVDSLRLSDVEASGLQLRDLIVLAAADDNWPRGVIGLRIGIVTAIEPKIDAGGFAEVRIRPEVDLTTLRQVLVVPD